MARRRITLTLTVNQSFIFVCIILYCASPDILANPKFHFCTVCINHTVQVPTLANGKFHCCLCISIIPCKSRQWRYGRRRIVWRRACRDTLAASPAEAAGHSFCMMRLCDHHGRDFVSLSVGSARDRVRVSCCVEARTGFIKLRRQHMSTPSEPTCVRVYEFDVAGPRKLQCHVISIFHPYQFQQ